jgi:hypothetical protein
MIFASLYPDKEEDNIVFVFSLSFRKTTLRVFSSRKRRIKKIAFLLSLPFHPRTPVSKAIGTNHFPAHFGEPHPPWRFVRKD